MNREVVLAEWRRSTQSLRAADLLSREDYPEDAVSRAYYAILHAARAALLVHDVSTSSHAGVKRMFGKHLVLTGRIEREWSRYLATGSDERLVADYDAEMSFSAEESRLECRRAGEFVERIRQYLTENGLTEQDLENGAPRWLRR